MPREQRVEDAQIEALSSETMAEREIGTGAELVRFDLIAQAKQANRALSRPQDKLYPLFDALRVGG